jgi:hypothetical protein
VRLVLDEHLDDAVAVELRRRGHDVVAVTEDPSLRGLADDDLLAWAADVGRVVVTYNARHFKPLSEGRQVRGEPFAGLIFLSTNRYPQGQRGALIRDLASVMETYPSPQAFKGLWRWLGSA